MQKVILLIILFPLILQADSFENTTMGFEENLGQLSDFEGKQVNDVLFYSRNNDIGVFITKTGVSYVIYRYEQLPQAAGMNQDLPGKDIQPQKLHYARIDVELVNSSIDSCNIEFFDEEPGYTNYYYAHCPDGVLNVKTFREVRIKEIYKGIDWIWKYDSKGILHHEFELSTDADPEDIKLKVKWADFEISPDGKKLTLSTPLGKIEDGWVIAHNSSSMMFPVEVRYKEKDGFINYDVLNWNRIENLIIDPPLALTWATYYGGSASDFARSITTDVAGNVFVTGSTRSTNFPTQNPGGGAYYQGAIGGSFSDVFILKFSNTGVRNWATYYGGDSWDSGISITTDNSGNVFVTGETWSINFPTQNPGDGAYFQGDIGGNFSDSFILKFSNTGIRNWATYYGGDELDAGISITTDNSGNVFVTGETGSYNFPTQNPGGGAYYQGAHGGVRDVFILKFSNTGVRNWATYYGGITSDGGFSITTDIAGNVFVTGYAWSGNFPTQNPGGGAYFQGTFAGGNSDAFILKFSNTGVRNWATFYGGISSDFGNSITTDIAGNVFVVGYTASNNFPTRNPGDGAYFQGSYGGNEDVFILKFSNTGVRNWATYYGGAGWDVGKSITTDIAGNVFVTGETRSTDFPIQNPGGGAYFQGANDGGGDGFILEFNNTGVRNWATYYGGSGYESGLSITADIVGNVFVTGWTNSTIFPTQNPGNGAFFQSVNGGGDYDAFISKFGDTPLGITPISNNIPENFALQQNYPNPFNPSTNIRFDIQKQGLVTLKVYDVLGKEVATLVNETLSPGTYNYQFSPNKSGQAIDNFQISSGVYFYKLETHGFSDVKRMVLLK